MKRWRVELNLSSEDVVEAATEEQAIAKACLAVEGGGYGIYVTSSYATEIPYVRPASTERWAAVADEMRFAEGHWRWLAGDGCWWWSDGHAAVRCELPCPDDQDHRLDRTIATVIGEHTRRRATWRAAKPFGTLSVRRDQDDRRVVVQDKYVRLVESGCPGVEVEWSAARVEDDDPWSVPVIAYAGSELVAVVMPVRDSEARR